MDKLHKFFSDNWAVQRNDFEHAASLLLPCVVAGNLRAAAEQLNEAKCKAQGVTPNVARWYDLDDINLPSGTVAVITLRGVLYAWETEWLILQIDKAEQNPNICGIVLEIDGPGGMVSHVDQAAERIAGCSKPVATVVTGTMASAHFWLGTSAQHTFIASTLCEVGSVGVVFTYYSFKKFFEQNGIKHYEIYPDTADLKNREVRALEDNDDEAPLKERAERIHRVFAETVARNLGIDYDPTIPIFRGEVFTADDAVAAGYIDERGTLTDAVRWVIGQATIREINKIY